MKRLLNEYREKQKNPLYDAVMQMIVRANEEKFREADCMCEALNRIIQDQIEEKIRKSLQAGYDEGYGIGMQDGIKDGMQRGMQQGMQQGRLFEIYLSVQEGDYSAKRGAEKAEMSLDEFEKAMSKAGYKIPELV